MTVKELYEWAKENGLENNEVEYSDDGRVTEILVDDIAYDPYRPIIIIGGR